MFGGMNPKQMAQLMKQMGIKNEEIPCAKVIIEKTDGGKIVVTEPNVVLIEMQGQKSFQVSGTISSDEEEGEKQENSDAKMVAEETGCTLEQATKALEETNGDIAEAIMKLKK